MTFAHCEHFLIIKIIYKDSLFYFVFFFSLPETAMGVSVHAQTNADSEYVQAVKT